MGLTNLPIEIIDHILDFLHNDKYVLKVCTLTCKSFLPACRTHLFHHITLSSPFRPKGGEFPYFSLALAPQRDTIIPDAPNLENIKPYIQRLTLAKEQREHVTHITSTTLGFIISHLPSLRYLHLENLAWVPSPASRASRQPNTWNLQLPKSLEGLYLKGIEIKGQDPLLTLLEYLSIFSHIGELHIESIDYGRPSIPRHGGTSLHIEDIVPPHFSVNSLHLSPQDAIGVVIFDILRNVYSTSQTPLRRHPLRSFSAVLYNVTQTMIIHDNIAHFGSTIQNLTLDIFFMRLTMPSFSLEAFTNLTSITFGVWEYITSGGGGNPVHAQLRPMFQDTFPLIESIPQSVSSLASITYNIHVVDTSQPNTRNLNIYLFDQPRSSRGFWGRLSSSHFWNTLKQPQKDTWPELENLILGLRDPPKLNFRFVFKPPNVEAMDMNYDTPSRWYPDVRQAVDRMEGLARGVVFGRLSRLNSKRLVEVLRPKLARAEGWELEGLR